MSECQNCAELTRIIEQQQAQIKRLTIEILRLKRIIDIAAGLCATVAMEADNVLSKPQPRGIWAFNKGKQEAAERISVAIYY